MSETWYGRIEQILWLKKYPIRVFVYIYTTTDMLYMENFGKCKSFKVTPNLATLYAIHTHRGPSSVNVLFLAILTIN